MPHSELDGRPGAQAFGLGGERAGDLDGVLLGPGEHDEEIGVGDGDLWPEQVVAVDLAGEKADGNVGTGAISPSFSSDGAGIHTACRPGSGEAPGDRRPGHGLVGIRPARRILAASVSTWDRRPLKSVVNFGGGMTGSVRLAGAALIWLLTGGAAVAAPEEIQVYMDEMSVPGTFGLDIHTNYVVTGDLLSDRLGEQQSLHRLRVTPEFAYGLTPNLEAGLYLPLATLDGAGRLGVDGAKVRLKFIAPKAPGQTWFWGLNFEIGGVDRRLDANPYNAELKGIVGARAGPWTVAFNANLDFKVSGPAPSPASLDLDTKVSYALGKSLAIGVETYNGAGELHALGRFGASEQSTFATIDKSFGRWDVNLGLGSGYGANADHFIIKAVIGVPIG